MSVHYRCYYTKEFPIDEYGRLGGFYSLADLPIVKYDRISRPGILEAKNEESQMYKIRDAEKNFTEWVPMMDVNVGEIIDE